MQPTPAPFPTDDVGLVTADGIRIKRKLYDIGLVVQRFEFPGVNNHSQDFVRRLIAFGWLALDFSIFFHFIRPFGFKVSRCSGSVEVLNPDSLFVQDQDVTGADGFIQGNGLVAEGVVGLVVFQAECQNDIDVGLVVFDRALEMLFLVFVKVPARDAIMLVKKRLGTV